MNFNDLDEKVKITVDVLIGILNFSVSTALIHYECHYKEHGKEKENQNHRY